MPKKPQMSAPERASPCKVASTGLHTCSLQEGEGSHALIEGQQFEKGGTRECLKVPGTMNHMLIHGALTLPHSYQTILPDSLLAGNVCRHHMDSCLLQQHL